MRITRHTLRAGPLALLYAVTLLFCCNANADVFRPAYLEMQQVDAERYEVLWRVPAKPGQRRLQAQIVFPASVERGELLETRQLDDVVERRFPIHARGGLNNASIHIEGILGIATDIIVRVERLNGTTQLERLRPSKPTFKILPSPGPGEIAWDYFVLGVEHILLGIDHLLFVLALLLLVRQLRRLVLTLTAFTIAHSITLACATLGWIHVPGPPVEAVIALSIVFVATEVIKQQQNQGTLASRAPWLVAFAFGLLHGLGFAGALEEVGLPDSAIGIALLMFNLGVEAGQLLFVAAMLFVTVLLSRFTSLSQHLVSRLLSYGIGSVAAFWTIERVAAFFP